MARAQSKNSSRHTFLAKEDRPLLRRRRRRPPHDAARHTHDLVRLPRRPLPPSLLRRLRQSGLELSLSWRPLPLPRSFFLTHGRTTTTTTTTTTPPSSSVRERRECLEGEGASRIGRRDQGRGRGKFFQVFFPSSSSSSSSALKENTLCVRASCAHTEECRREIQPFPLLIVTWQSLIIYVGTCKPYLE